MNHPSPASVPTGKLENEQNISTVNVLKALASMKISYYEVLTFLATKLSAQHTSNTEKLTYP